VKQAYLTKRLFEVNSSGRLPELQTLAILLMGSQAVMTSPNSVNLHAARFRRQEGHSRTRTVLHLIETSGIGGAERVVVDLVRYLAPQRWRSIVLVPDVGWLPDTLRSEGFDVVEMREHRSFDIAFLLRARGLARDVGAELLHSHLFGSAVRAAMLSRLSGVPAVATIHGAQDFRRTERWSAIKLAIARSGIREFVFVSEPLRQVCMKAMGLREDRTCVINNGVDVGRFSSNRDASTRSEWNIPPDAFVVGSVGRLQPVKGLETFLEAAAILKEASPEYRFVIVGDGHPEYKRQLVALSHELGLSELVVFAGFRPDASDAMAAFDVYTLTSRSEGFSLTTIEAMASGVPVVATRCGGPEQILADSVTGLLVENGSAAAVARAVERLRVAPAERRQLAAAARAMVLERYTVEAQIRAYEQLYERVLSTSARG
jgi:glycosyltransferase involved in cell wall biosynthesis